MYIYEDPDFTAYIIQVASQKQIPEAIVEKDYWVTLALYHLVTSKFENEFIFKGGTSLSKAYKLIERFSEDIDLLFLSEKTGAPKGSKEKRRELQNVKDYLLTKNIFKYDETGENSSGAEHRTSCFVYPSQYSMAELLPHIKLEMGYRGGKDPSEEKEITSLIAESLVGAKFDKPYLDLKPFKIKMLAPERTFVEKLFAICSAYLKGDSEKKVRHYYDVFQLLKRPSVVAFLSDPNYKELKKEIESFSDNFGGPIVKHDELHLSEAFSPKAETLEKITKAHNSSDLIYGTKPSMSEIIELISKYKAQF